jgi:hypothetical protein
MEVLHALAGRVAGAEIPVEEELRIYRHLMKSVPEVLVTGAYVPSPGCVVWVMALVLAVWCGLWP